MCMQAGKITYLSLYDYTIMYTEARQLYILVFIQSKIIVTYLGCQYLLKKLNLSHQQTYCAIKDYSVQVIQNNIKQ